MNHRLFEIEEIMSRCDEQGINYIKPRVVIEKIKPITIVEYMNKHCAAMIYDFKKLDIDINKKRQLFKVALYICYEPKVKNPRITKTKDCLLLYNKKYNYNVLLKKLAI